MDPGKGFPVFHPGRDRGIGSGFDQSSGPEKKFTWEMIKVSNGVGAGMLVFHCPGRNPREQILSGSGTCF